ncbi:hypothetical protein A8F94_07205 [Bacillus sp. FJAT-27225]|uniref:DUF5946 family protein n=1 Tax=Bacillus sp. FJAT-27225 TaxID=1743144 RepID=UPI00080C3218|nr:DUF5946 family protein [Bacillus sp. FJAT-27225]OCA87638.1 hypothetical protein A8F94_07205 [Bacillus sp. FJAT-27225]
MNRAIDYTKRCPECGAPEANGLDCFGQLGEILSWEHADPDLKSQHSWAVACYTIQHPARFKEDAERKLKEVFCQAYDSQLPGSDIWKEVSAYAEGKAKPHYTPVFRDWAMTISEVYLVGERKGAADRVRAWSKIVRKQMQQE